MRKPSKERRCWSEPLPGVVSSSELSTYSLETGCELPAESGEALMPCVPAESAVLVERPRIIDCD